VQFSFPPHVSPKARDLILKVRIHLKPDIIPLNENKTDNNNYVLLSELQVIILTSMHRLLQLDMLQ
jgi:hypothetical protein